jgi:hypothetical protein
LLAGPQGRPPCHPRPHQDARGHREGEAAGLLAHPDQPPPGPPDRPCCPDQCPTACPVHPPPACTSARRARPRAAAPPVPRPAAPTSPARTRAARRRPCCRPCPSESSRCPTRWRRPPRRSPTWGWNSPPRPRQVPSRLLCRSAALPLCRSAAHPLHPVRGERESVILFRLPRPDLAPCPCLQRRPVPCPLVAHAPATTSPHTTPSLPADCMCPPRPSPPSSCSVRRRRPRRPPGWQSPARPAPLSARRRC